MVNSLIFVYNANRDNGAMVIHAPTILHDDDEVEMNRYSSKGELFKAETWNSGFCSELTPTANDIIIPGKAHNMIGLELMRVLEEKKIKKLFVCGFLLEVSVHDTAIGLCTELDDIDIIYPSWTATIAYGLAKILDQWYQQW